MTAAEIRVKEAGQLDSAKCPLCGVPTGRVLSRQLRRGKGVVFHCANCDHGFLVPERRLDSKTYYSEAYWQEVSHKASSEGTNASELYDVYSKYQHERLEIIGPHLFPATKLLEIGASAGQFLAHVKDRVAKAHAIELDKSCVDFMRKTLGIDADAEFLRESKFASEKYDVLCSFQVMEHVDSPLDFLRDLRASMHERSIAFVEVPNLRDPLLAIWNVPAYETFYYHSAHLHYFTEKSLRKVAVDAGFAPAQVSIQFTQDYNLLNHLNWIMNNAPQPTCDLGLSEINIPARDATMATWLTQRLREVNREYIGRLVQAKATSNLMAVLSNAS
jgi:2-polyprenyl-3-methyl-5-hydroxy-6-metoxy-1,4-benzoquinol methylase